MSELVRDVFVWGYDTLSALGTEPVELSPKVILDTPWSCVARYETNNGSFYLKQTPKLISSEPIIIDTLSREFKAHVPEVVAHNKDLNCFIMKDAGISLRQILKQKFDLKLLLKTIEQFTNLQVGASEKLGILLDLEVPDWRLNNLPNLYAAALSDEKLLGVDGLSPIEIEQARSLVADVSKLCDELSKYPIMETIVQPDFNDNNTLFDESSNKLTIIDLGEISISHPFFSLFNFLTQIQRHHNPAQDDCLALKSRCFSKYAEILSQDKLDQAIETASRLMNVYGILSQIRLMHACGKDVIMEFQPGRLANSIREFISCCRNK